MPGSWSDFLKLRSGPAPPPSSEAGAVRVYADANGALRAIQSDGTDTAIGGGGGSTPSVLTEITTLTPTQIKSLATTAVVLVPAPGVGKFIVPMSVAASLSYATETYLGGIADVELLSSSNPGGESSLGWTGTSFTTIEQANNAQELVTLTAPLTPGDHTAVIDNRPLAIFNFGDEYTVGDSPYTITVCYYVANLM